MEYGFSCFMVRGANHKRYPNPPVGAIWYVGWYRGKITVKLRYNPNLNYIPKFDKLLYSFKLKRKDV